MQCMLHQPASKAFTYCKHRQHIKQNGISVYSETHHTKIVDHYEAVLTQQ